MVNLNFNINDETKTFSMKSKIEDMLLDDFQKINNIVDSDSEFVFLKYLDIIEVLTGDKEVLDYITEDNFYRILKEIDLEETNTTLVKSFEFGGYTFTRNGVEDDLTLTIRQLSLIEEHIVKYPKDYMVRIISVIFNTDETLTENDKLELLRNVPLSIVLPHIVKINFKIIDNVKKLIETINA